MRLRRLTLAVAAAAACCCGVAAASAVTGTDSPRAHGEGDTAHLRARPGTDVLGAVADDPVGGPQWGVRRSTSETGSVCVEIGRFNGGAFGAAGGDGRVASQPLADHGLCAAARDRPLVAVARFSAAGAQGARTVVYGHVGHDAQRVAVRAGGYVREVAIGAHGTFVSPIAGIQDPGHVAIEVTSAGGVRSTERL